MALTSKDGERPPRDIYALAYLCGGTSGLLTLYLYELVQQGHLEIVEIKKWNVKEWYLAAPRVQPPTNELSNISNQLLEWFLEPQRAVNTYQRVFPHKLMRQCSSYRDALFKRGLIKGRLLPERQNELFGWILGLSMMSLLAWAFIFEHPYISDSNVIAVIFFGFMLSLGLSSAIYSAIKIRLSLKGNRHVLRLKNKLDHLRQETISTRSGALHLNHRCAIAIFGVSALAQNSFNKFLEQLDLIREYGTEKGAASGSGGG